MKKQPLNQRCFHAYLISTGTASTVTRICVNPSCSLGLTLCSSSSASVSRVVVFFFFFCPSLNICYTVVWFGKLKPEDIDR